MVDPFRSDSIEQRDMPSGSCIFELDMSSKKRWGRHRNYVAFPVKLTRIPTSISFTDVEFDGTADLVVTKITQKGFWFMVTSQGTGERWGLTSVSFDWEAQYNE